MCVTNWTIPTVWSYMIHHSWFVVPHISPFLMQTAVIKQKQPSKSWQHTAWHYSTVTVVINPEHWIFDLTGKTLPLSKTTWWPVIWILFCNIWEISLSSSGHCISVFLGSQRMERDHHGRCDQYHYLASCKMQFVWSLIITIAYEMAAQKKIFIMWLQRSQDGCG